MLLSEIYFCHKNLIIDVFNAQSFYPCVPSCWRLPLSPSNPVLSHHISSQFNEDLQDAVNTKFMTMGGLVEQQGCQCNSFFCDTDANLAN